MASTYVILRSTTAAEPYYKAGLLYFRTHDGWTAQVPMTHLPPYEYEIDAGLWAILVEEDEE